MSGDKYRVVCFVRAEEEPEREPLSLEEAKKEVRQQKIMLPDNHYEIELIEDWNERKP